MSRAQNLPLGAVIAPAATRDSAPRRSRRSFATASAPTTARQRAFSDHQLAFALTFIAERGLGVPRLDWMRPTDE